MKVSEKGIKLIKESEGFKPNAYMCPAGVWTIGYGSTNGVTQGMIVTERFAETLLKNHLAKTETQITSLNLSINQNQFDALADFVYNLGFGAFKSSTLLKLIVAKSSPELIKAEFRKWNKGNGKVLPGLVTRREAEIRLYFS